MKKSLFSMNSKGMALTVTLVIVIILALLATFAASMGYNQRKLIDASSGKRAKIYYRARAGVVDAFWRIRSDYTVGLAPAGSFTTANYNPNPYSIDVDGDGTNDTTIDIGPVTVPGTGQRQIISTGLDI